MNKKLRTLYLIFILIFSLSCANKKFNKRIFPFPKKNFSFTNKIQGINNFIQICYDKKTKKLYPRFKAIILTLKKVLKLKNKNIIIKYFLSPDNNNKRKMLKDVLNAPLTSNVIITQMGFWRTNVFDQSINDISNYGQLKWLAYNNFDIDKTLLLRNKNVIMPNSNLLRKAKNVGHVMGFVKNKKYYGMPLFIKWKKFLIPSLSLFLALHMKKVNLNKNNIKIIKLSKGYTIKFGNTFLKTDLHFNIKTYFPKKVNLKTVSMIDIILGKVKINENFIFISDKIIAPIVQIKNNYSIDSNALFIYHALSILKEMRQ